MKNSRSFIASICFALCFPSNFQAELIDDWHPSHPLPSAFNVFNAAFGNGTYVILGARGTLITSTDLEKWNIEKRFEWLENVIFDGTRFVISGYHGDMLVSPDGLNWTVHASGTGEALSGLDYGGGRYVAAGRNGTTATSTDGMNWQISSTGDDNWSYGVAYGDGLFVAVSVDDPNYLVSGSIVTSSNGVDWSPVTLPGGLPTYMEFWDIDHGDGRFIAVGYYWDEIPDIEGALILTSTDGINWTHINDSTIPNETNSDSIWLDAIRYDSDNSRWVAAGDAGLVMVSNDGTTWSVAAASLGASTDFYGMTFGSLGTTVVGRRGKVYSSADLTEWTENSSGNYVRLGEIAFQNGQLLAGSSGGQVLASGDGGATWTPGNTTASGTLRNLVFGQGYWVAGNDSIRPNDTPISISPDGLNWSLPATVPEGFEDCRGLAFGNGVFVAVPVGGGSSLIHSTDAMEWIGTSHPWFTQHQQSIFVEFGGGQFVAFASGAPNVEVAVSSDGMEWQIHDTGTTTKLLAAGYGNGRWVFVGEDGQVVTTTDFQDWNEQVISFGAKDPVWLEGVAYGAGHWIITGRDHSIWSSTDGLDWEDAFTTELTGSNAIFYKSVFDGSSFWTVGPEGVIYQSESLAAALTPPVLAIERTASPDEYLLRIEGTAGQTWDLIHSPMFPATSWNTLQPVQLESGVHFETIQVPQGMSEGYLRLREPQGN